MKMVNKVLVVGSFVISAVSFTGCGALENKESRLQIYSLPDKESDWIRNGEPIEFEGERWFPQDDVVVLLDSEVFLLGEYRGVNFFVEQIDIRPYQRLYTKFGHNKFRIFEKKTALENGELD